MINQRFGICGVSNRKPPLCGIIEPKLSQSLILSYVAAVLTNQIIRKFSNIITYCKKS